MCSAFVLQWPFYEGVLRQQNLNVLDFRLFLEEYMESLEAYFSTFRKNIIGIDQTFESPYGTQRLHD